MSAWLLPELARLVVVAAQQVPVDQAVLRRRLVARNGRREVDHYVARRRQTCPAVIADHVAEQPSRERPTQRTGNRSRLATNRYGRIAKTPGPLSAMVTQQCIRKRFRVVVAPAGEAERRLIDFHTKCFRYALPVSEPEVNSVVLVGGTPAFDPRLVIVRVTDAATRQLVEHADREAAVGERTLLGGEEERRAVVD